MDLDTKKMTRVSPGMGRTTCGYFRPDGKRIIFASSHGDPDAKKHQEAEYKQRAEDAKKSVRRRYSWDFDPHMKIYEANLDGSELKCLTPDAKVYTAEGSYSADGTKIVYSAGTAGDTNLFIMNADGTGARQLTAGHQVLQRRAVLQPGCDEGHLPGRSQGEGPAATLRHQRRRHRASEH